MVPYQLSYQLFSRQFKISYDRLSTMQISKLNNFLLTSYTADKNEPTHQAGTKTVARELLPKQEMIMVLIYNNDFLRKNPRPQERTTPYNKYITAIHDSWELARQEQKNIENLFLHLYYDFKSHPDGLAEKFITAERSEVFVPEPRLFKYEHADALDIFFKKVDKAGVAERGPNITSLSSGIVMAAANDWEGGTTKLSYRGGGLSPKAGNGVIIYNPKKERYYYYAHFSEVYVEPGTIVTPGTVIGRGGNTGLNARKKGHGRHLHFEIFDAKLNRKMTIHELHQLLFCK